MLTNSHILRFIAHLFSCTACGVPPHGATSISMAANGSYAAGSLTALLMSTADAPADGSAAGSFTRSAGRTRARSRGAAGAEDDEDGSGVVRRGGRRAHGARLRAADARTVASAAAAAITPSDRSCDLVQLHALIDGLASRWLQTAELYRFLHSFRRFGIPVLDAALQRPASGTWALYAPGVKVRADGYDYAKRQDANNYTIVKEGHVTLHINGIPTIACYYATREDRPSFSRRIYWLVEREFTAAPPMPAHVADAHVLRPTHPVSLDRYLPSVVPLPPPDGTAIDPAVRGVILAHYVDSEDTVTPHAVALNASVWANAMRASSDASARHSASKSTSAALGEEAEADAVPPSSTSSSGRPQRTRRGLLRPGAPTSVLLPHAAAFPHASVATGMTPSPATDAHPLAQPLMVPGASASSALGAPAIIAALDGDEDAVHGSTAPAVDILQSVSVRGSMERTSLDVAQAWRTSQDTRGGLYSLPPDTHLSASLAQAGVSYTRPMSNMSMASHGGDAILPRRTPRPLSVLSSLSDTPAGASGVYEGPITGRIVLVNPPCMSMRRVDAAMVCYDTHAPLSTSSSAGPSDGTTMPVPVVKAITAAVVCANLAPLFPASFAALTTAAVQTPITHVAHNVILIPAMPVLRDFAAALAGDPRLSSLGMTAEAVVRAASQLPAGYQLHATLTLFHADASRASAPFVCAYALDGEDVIEGDLPLPERAPDMTAAARVSSGDMGVPPVDERPFSMSDVDMQERALVDVNSAEPSQVMSPTSMAPTPSVIPAAPAPAGMDVYAHTGKRSREDAAEVPSRGGGEDGDESLFDGDNCGDDADFSDGYYSDAAHATSPEMSAHDTDVVRLEVETDRLLVRVTEQLAQLEAYADDRTSVVSDAATSVRARARAAGRPVPRRRSFTSDASRGDTSARSPRVQRAHAPAAPVSASAACVALPMLRDAANGRTLLHMAVTTGSVDIACALVAAGADIRAADAFGITPLAIAYSTGNVAMVQALEKAWAELSEGERKRGNSTLDDTDDGMSVTTQRKRAAIQLSADSDVRVPGLGPAGGGISSRRRTIASSVSSADDGHMESQPGDEHTSSVLSMAQAAPNDMSAAGVGGPMSMVDRRVLLDAFDSLSLREKLAVARALQLPVPADGGTTQQALQQRLDATLASMDVTGSSSANAASIAALRDMFTQETLALAGERTRSVAHAMSLMSTEELADTEAEAMRIQSNVRAWLARRNYQHVRHATRTLQRAIRNMLARRRQRSGDAGQTESAHTGVAAAASSSDLPTIQEMHELPDAMDLIRGESVSSLVQQAAPQVAGVGTGAANGTAAGALQTIAQPPASLDLDVQRSKTRAHAAGVLQRSLRRWYGHAVAHPA